MKQTQEELYLEKIQIERKIEDTDNQIKDISKLENSYEEIFNQLTPLASKLQEHYHGSRTASYFNDLSLDLRRKQQEAFDSLNEEGLSLKKNQRDLDDEREVIYQSYHQSFAEEKEEQTYG